MTRDLMLICSVTVLQQLLPARLMTQLVSKVGIAGGAGAETDAD